jgi:hypothetical protein
MANGDPFTKSPSDTALIAAPASFAWQPLTPGGVAAFARASLTRLWVVQALVAGFTSGVFLWLLYETCLPVLHQALLRLPEKGQIRNQVLVLPGFPQPTLLAEGRVLAFAVDMSEQNRPGSTSDFLVEFHRNDFQVCSLLGCLALDYPRHWIVEMNRKELEPWWQAWEPACLTLLGLAVLVGLFLVWNLLGTACFLVPWLVAHFSDRTLNLRGGWRLASAAQMPGAFLLMLAMVLYGLGWVDLIRFAILILLHLLVAWFYFVAAARALPRPGEAALRAGLPFEPEPESRRRPKLAPPSDPNPFAAPNSAPSAKRPENGGP